MLYLLILLLTPQAAHAADELPAASARQLEEQAVAQRRSIVRGSVTLETKVVASHEGGAPFSVNRRVWFDGSKYRCDTHLQGKGGLDERTILCWPCEQDGQYLQYRFTKKSDERRAVLLQPTRPDTREQVDIIDPRILGLVPWGTNSLRYDDLQSVLMSPNRSDEAVAQATWKGRPCYLVTFTSKAAHSPTYRIWVVPEMQFGVPRITMQKRQDGALFEASVESELRQFGPQKSWFPSRSEYIAHHGEKLYAREMTQVSEVTLNEPLPPNTFKFVGLGLPPKTVVVNKAKKGERPFIIDGDIVSPVPKRESPTELPQKVGDDAPRRKWFISLAAALALLAGGAFVCYLARRRRATPA